MPKARRKAKSTLKIMGAGLKHITQGIYDDCVYVSLNKLRINQ